MKTRSMIAFFVTALLALSVVACGKKAASTPTEAFQSFYNAAKAKDTATLKTLMSKQFLEEAEREAKSENKSLDDFIANESQKGLPAKMPEIRDEKVEGDKATIQIKSENTTNWSTVSFVKEDGGWKVSM